MIKIYLLFEEIIEAGLPIETLYGYSNPILANVLPLVETLDLEQVVWSTSLSNEEQTIFDNLVNNHNPDNLTSTETAESNFNDAKIEIKNLPDWSTWTPQEAQDNIVSMILDGRTLASIQTDIDNINNIAGVKTALSTIASAIISIRNVLSVIGKILIYIFRVIR